ncbi:MAG: response regulator [Planctomycetes bacterium]|nr:response regulator [Planctomycetota bacterium]
MSEAGKTYALVLQGDRVSRLCVVSILKSFGISIFSCENVVQALHCITLHPEIQICIIDYRIKPLSGLAFLRALYKEPLYKDLHMVMLSSESGADEVKAALQYDCLHYLLKPASKEKLKNCIEKLGFSIQEIQKNIQEIPAASPLPTATAPAAAPITPAPIATPTPGPNSKPDIAAMPTEIAPAATAIPTAGPVNVSHDTDPFEQSGTQRDDDIIPIPITSSFVESEDQLANALRDFFDDPQG